MRAGPRHRRARNARTPNRTRRSPRPWACSKQRGADAAVGLEALSALGYDSAKGRAVFNCLSKLGRAAPARGGGGAGGAAALSYRLI